MAKAKHTIRIISGTHRSRRLPVLDSDGLRPTGDRVRETLFNWLQTHIVEQNVLDLCAGSGALGFEAASRGAKQVTMIEKNSRVCHQLIKVKDQFEFNNVTIVNTSAQQFAMQTNSQYNVVFIDPPFALNLTDELTQLAKGIIKPMGFIYRESLLNTKLQQLDKSWQLYRQKNMGQVKIELWQQLHT